MSGLLQLVESLHSGLTSTEGSVKRDTFIKLNSGIRCVPTSNITEKDVSHIVNFYTAHLVLADPDLVGTLLDGLLWFASNSLLDAACAVKICTEGFFSNLNIQSLRKSDRQIAHKILLSLLLNEQTRTGLVGMKLEFIRGFIISIESEKDPQCLLSVFAMHPILIKHFDFGALAEEHFDCMAAYFPVDYIPPPGNPSGVLRVDLVSRLHASLFASRHIDGNFLLPLLIEKASSHWSQGRSDALALLADCLVGVPQAVSLLSNFELKFNRSLKRDPVADEHVAAYRFALCNVVRELIIEIDPDDRGDDARQLFTIVAGLVHSHAYKPDEADFVETFLKSVWPDRRNEDNLVRLDGWFSVPPAVQLLPCTAPQELVADCLLTAALASPASAMVPRLFARLAEPLLWPRVTPMPSEDCFYRAKCDQLGMWTQHVAFLNRTMSYLSRHGNASLKVLHLTETSASAIAFNLSHTLRRGALHRLQKARSSGGAGADVEMDHEERGEDSGFSQSALTVCFSLLCRVLALLTETDDDVTTSFLELCPTLLETSILVKEDESKNTNEAIHTALRHQQMQIMADLIAKPSMVQEELLLLLFKLLQEESGNDLADIVLDILKIAACENREILNQLFTLLFARCADAVGHVAAEQLISSLLFVARSPSFKDVPLLAQLVHAKASDVFSLTDHLINALPSAKATCCLQDLLATLHLIGGKLTIDQQSKFLRPFADVCQTGKVPSVYASLLLDSAIISTIQPALAQVPWTDLLNGLMESFQMLVHRPPSCEALDDLLTDEVCLCAASLLNKCPEASGTMSHILDFLIDAPKSCPARSHNLAARFIVLCLRSCLVSASCTQQTCTSEQRRLIDRLVGLLTNPSTAVHELQQVCLLRTIHLLLEEGRENSEVTSGVDRNPLATQKCYCLVGLRLKAAWETLKQQGNDDKAEAAFLFAYLKLTSLLPDSIIADFAAEALETSVVAVTSGRYPQDEIQAQGLFLVSRLAALGSTATLISPQCVDGLFEKLPLLLQQRTDDALKANQRQQGTGAAEKEAYLLRYHLARCLTFLVECDPAVTSRHRVRVRRLLEALLDDNCQSVRLQAARANNLWHLKV